MQYLLIIIFLHDCLGFIDNYNGLSAFSATSKIKKKIYSNTETTLDVISLLNDHNGQQQMNVFSLMSTTQENWLAVIYTEFIWSLNVAVKTNQLLRDDRISFQTINYFLMKRGFFKAKIRKVLENLFLESQIFEIVNKSTPENILR